ncbi:leucine-rich melanocyte differentiation-associated protein-like [Liolophura sinensis]|uniref:leucine-rich melanocyte differentiation-associated protein-like n=1 Tax=Liolophura sinensis TaxID=3198878 RepID=UPI0031595F20
MSKQRVSLAYQGFKEMPFEFAEFHGRTVEELDLSYNSLSDLRFLIGFDRLNTLILDHNIIDSHVKMPLSLPSLHTLWVNHNNIKNLAVFISTLTNSCPNLRMLSMMNNEAAPSYFNGGTLQQYIDYRQYVIAHIPNLEALDDKKLEPGEREEAERIYGRHIPFEVKEKIKNKRRIKRSKSSANSSTT